MDVVSGCRDRQRQLLLQLDDAGALPLPEFQAALDDDGVLREAPPASGRSRFPVAPGGSDGAIGLTAEGRDWLLEADRPSRGWGRHVAPPSPPLRAWQTEALDAWSSHGRHGVIEAVTGTGKSRVGVEATREALADDYNVVIVGSDHRPGRPVGQDAAAEQGSRSRRPRRRQQATFAPTGSSSAPSSPSISNPPTRPDGKVLLVADECHRYGAGQWRRALHPSYRRRLGLTATFERNDDGLKDLLPTSAAAPVFTIGFPPRHRQTAWSLTTTCKLLGVPLTRAERAEYDEADKTLRDARTPTPRRGLPGRTVRCVPARGAEGSRGRRRPHHHRRRTPLPQGFLQAHRRHDQRPGETRCHPQPRAPRRRSGGAIVFTRRVEMAEEIAATLVEAGVRASPIHSDLTRTQRNDRLSALKIGRLKALVAPTVARRGHRRPRHRPRRRHGRVSLPPPDDPAHGPGPPAQAGRPQSHLHRRLRRAHCRRPKLSDGAEGCLDLIVECADSVTPLTLDDDKVIPSDLVHRRVIDPSPPFHLDDVAPASHPLGPGAVRDYRTAHGTDQEDATASLRRLLHDLLLIGGVRPSKANPDGFGAVSSSGFELVVSAEGVTGYRSRRPDAATWEDLVDNEDETTAVVEHVDVLDEGATSTPVQVAGLIKPVPPTPRQSAPQTTPPPGRPDDHAEPYFIDHLERLAALHREGLLTAAEFSTAKSRLLG